MNFQITVPVFGAQYIQAITTLLASEHEAVRLLLPSLENPDRSAPLVLAQWWGTMLVAPQRAAVTRLLIPAPRPRAEADAATAAAAIGLRRAGWDVKWTPPGPPMDTRMAIFGSSVLVLGSHDLPARTLTPNLAASIITREPHAVDDCRRWFDALWRDALDTPMMSAA